MVCIKKHIWFVCLLCFCFIIPTEPRPILFSSTFNATATFSAVVLKFYLKCNHALNLFYFELWGHLFRNALNTQLLWNWPQVKYHKFNSLQHVEKFYCKNQSYENQFKFLDQISQELKLSLWKQPSFAIYWASLKITFSKIF